MMGFLGVLGLPQPTPPWVLANDVGVDIDFVNNRGVNMGTTGTSTSFLTASRATAGATVYIDDIAGNWTSVADNLPRRSNKGLLVEEGRINGIRNNSKQGVVAGTVRTVVTVTSLSRTASATAVAAAAGHNLAVGDIVTVTGASVATYNGAFVVSAVSAGVSFSYVTSTSTTDSATSAVYTAISPGTVPTNWQITVGLGVASAITGSGTDAQGIDYIDVRIAGLPSGTGTVNVYPETSTGIAAVTAQTWAVSHFLALNDTTLIPANAISIGYDERTSGGVFVTQAGTALSNASIPAGNLIRKSFSGTLNGGATTAVIRPLVYLNFVNATPVNYTVRIGWPQCEQGGFASTPIRTTAGAGTRGGEVVTLTSPPRYASAFTLFGQGYSFSPNDLAFNTIIGAAVTSSFMDSAYIYRRPTGSSIVGGETVVASSFNTDALSTSWAVNTSGKAAFSVAPGTHSIVFNAGSAVTQSITWPPASALGLTELGLSGSLGQAWNGYIERIGIWPTNALSTARKQTITAAT